MKTRKWILGEAALTVAVMLLAGCVSQTSRGSSQSVASDSAPTQSVTSAASEPAQSVIASEEPQSAESAPSAATVREVAVGDTITTANLEVTIGYAMFVNKVEAHQGSNILNYVWQTADEGKILLDVSVYIKNLQQRAFTGTDVLKVTADYNSGYIYDNTREAIEWGSGLESTSSFMGMSVEIDPLDTVEVRYVIDCPAEVAENTNAPLFLDITLEGVKYQLTMR